MLFCSTFRLHVESNHLTLCPPLSPFSKPQLCFSLFPSLSPCYTFAHPLQSTLNTVAKDTHLKFKYIVSLSCSKPSTLFPSHPESNQSPYNGLQSPLRLAPALQPHLCPPCSHKQTTRPPCPAAPSCPLLSTSATRASLLFPEDARHNPASGPLHKLFPLPRKFLLGKSSWLHPSCRSLVQGLLNEIFIDNL